MLSKTTYLTFTQCPKAFWLDAYQPHLAAPPDPAAQRRLRAGQEVDKLAREQFANGRLIPYRPHPAEMAALTRQAIADGAETLFQATFIADDLLVKADILTQTASGWQLIEVKSSTQYKAAEHLPDVAFQVYVLRQTGLPVAQASRYIPDINDGVRVNIAPLQKAGLLAADVLAAKDIDKAIADRADERRWCREGKLPRPGWWA